MNQPNRLPPASCCSCLGLERTSKCLTPSCPPSALTSQTCWMTVRTMFHKKIHFIISPLSLFCIFRFLFKLLRENKVEFSFPALRQCSICQAVAEWECFQCYEDLDITPGHLKQYCPTCNTQVTNKQCNCCFITIFLLFLFFSPS